ncbi:MAG: DUF177 domain-containing protein [Flavobacteriales bacterium]|nr:DUF177 domain-containing protein [Flavobacteriales bacterium]
MLEGSAIGQLLSIEVEKSSEYLISFVGLKDGEHSFQFYFDDEFFLSFENSLIGSCDIKGEVVMNKKATLLEMQFSHEGIVYADCDRCGQPMELNIEGQEELIFKFSNQTESNSDEIKFIAPNEDQIDVAPLFYEFISLSLPSRQLHNDGDCDSEVIEVLENINLKETEETDPRWDALKKLKKDQKK